MSARQPKSGSKARVRQRPPRRKPVDLEAGINKAGERVAVDAVLAHLEPRILALAPEALAQRESHLLWVVDPDSVLLRAINGVRQPAKLEVLRAAMKGPGVALVPVDVGARMVEMIVDIFPDFAPLLEQIRTVTPLGFVRMFVQIGHCLALHLRPLAPGAIKEETAVN